MRLILVRHGETIENLKGIAQGQGFGRLSKEGITQAKKLALRLEKEKIDVAFCSDLRRAKRTLNEILKFHPKTKVHYSKLLREKKQGIFEGRPMALLREAAGKSRFPAHKFRPKGGESIEDLHERAGKFLKLLKKEKAENILISTHGGILASIISRFKGLDAEASRKLIFKNACVNVVEFNESGHKIKLLNCTKHLKKGRKVLSGIS